MPQDVPIEADIDSVVCRIILERRLNSLAGSWMNFLYLGNAKMVKMIVKSLANRGMDLR